MASTAIREFEITEGTISGGRYRITVRFKGGIVDEFTRDTMSEARDAFDSAGYKLVAWREGSRIVLQDRE